MGISCARFAIRIVFPSVVAYNCEFPIVLSEIIYNLPDKRLELRTEYDMDTRVSQN
jgi:hypothetical protein